MSDNYDVVTELARLLAEATRARRLAEAAAMDERCGARAFERNQAADEARRVAEQRGDELEAAQAQIAELSAKLAQAENAVRWQRERAEIAQAEMDRMQLTRSQVLVGRAGDASRLEQELRVLRDEIAAQNADAARVRAELEEERDVARRRAAVAERELADARAALAAAHEHDAAEVARLQALREHDAAEVKRLRGLLGDVAKAWHHEAMAGDGFMPGHDDLYMRARSVARGES